MVILKPIEFKPLIADSRPDPGPLTSISKLSIPFSLICSATVSAAFWAAKGVLFLDPLNPWPPALDQARVFPCLSVTLIRVLLKEA